MRNRLPLEILDYGRVLRNERPSDTLPTRPNQKRKIPNRSIFFRSCPAPVKAKEPAALPEEVEVSSGLERDALLTDVASGAEVDVVDDVVDVDDDVVDVVGEVADVTVTWSTLDEPPSGLTDAWSDSEVPAAALMATSRVMTAEAPGPIEAVEVHVTSCPSAEHAKPSPEPERNDSPAGS